MGRVLIVDGSATDRSRVAQLVEGLGHSYDEAPDGAEAFEKALVTQFDLVVTEAELAKLDAAALITKLRAHGIGCPVIALTAATKAAVVGAVMRAGIKEYVHKSVSAEALRQKLEAALASAAPSAPPPDVPMSSPSLMAAQAVLTGRVLLVDHLHDAQQRLRALLPPGVQLDAVHTVEEGLAKAEHGTYQLLLLDAGASVLNLSRLFTRLRTLQPTAALVGLATLGPHDAPATLLKSVAAQGFDEVLLKPFEAPAVHLLAEQYLSSLEQLVTVQDELVVVSRLRVAPANRSTYLRELEQRLKGALSGLADACVDHAILDFTRAMPIDADHSVELWHVLSATAQSLGIALAGVLPGDLAASLAGDPALKAMPRFTSVEAARKSFA